MSKARIAPGDLIGDALDLIEEDLNTTIVGGSRAGDESSEEDENMKRF